MSSPLPPPFPSAVHGFAQMFAFHLSSPARKLSCRRIERTVSCEDSTNIKLPRRGHDLRVEPHLRLFRIEKIKNGARVVENKRTGQSEPRIFRAALSLFLPAAEIDRPVIRQEGVRKRPNWVDCRVSRAIDGHSSEGSLLNTPSKRSRPNGGIERGQADTARIDHTTKTSTNYMRQLFVRLTHSCSKSRACTKRVQTHPLLPKVLGFNVSAPSKSSARTSPLTPEQSVPQHVRRTNILRLPLPPL